MKISIQSIVQIAIFAAIISICAQIRIPLAGGVPFTLQTTGVALAGVILGPKKGVVSVIIYILLGAVGAPVFNGLQGGIAVVFGPTGGFILSFPLLALAASFAIRKKHIIHWAIWLVLGVAVNLTIGMVFYAFRLETTILASFSVTVAPFLLTSMLQIALIITAGKALRHALIKSRVSI